jgi:hypothetical protein
MKRLPPEAFDHYLELGADRSYDAVALKYGVSRITVLRHAEKHRWQARLREAERGAREQSNKKAVDTLQVVKERQLTEARILEHRALEALKTLPPEKAGKAAAMLNIAWKHELLLLGEPSERTELTVEEVTKREIETLLRRVEVDEEEDADGEEEHP